MCIKTHKIDFTTMVQTFVERDIRYPDAQEGVKFQNNLNIVIQDDGFGLNPNYSLTCKANVTIDILYRFCISLS